MDFDFLMLYLVSPQTVYEFEPAARLLTSLSLSKEQLSFALARFADAFTNLTVDDRSFRAATNSQLMDRIYDLSAKASKMDLSVRGFVSSVGNYLRNHFHGDRCADNPAGVVREAKELAADFNTRFRSLAADTKTIAAIVPEDTKRTSLDGKAKVYVYWQGPVSRQMMADYKKLRFGTTEDQALDEKPTARESMAPYLGRAYRSRDEWLAAANDYLEKLIEWDVSGEPGTAGFHEKCLLFGALLDIVPKTGSLRDSVFTAYLSYLRSSAVERTSPPEWAHHVERLLRSRFEENDQLEFSLRMGEVGDATMQAITKVLLLERKTPNKTVGVE